MVLRQTPDVCKQYALLDGVYVRNCEDPSCTSCSEDSEDEWMVRTSKPTSPKVLIYSQHGIPPQNALPHNDSLTKHQHICTHRLHLMVSPTHKSVGVITKLLTPITNTTMLCLMSANLNLKAITHYGMMKLW